MGKEVFIKRKHSKKCLIFETFMPFGQSGINLKRTNEKKENNFKLPEIINCRKVKTWETNVK